MSDVGDDDRFAMEVQTRLREGEAPDAVIRARLSAGRARAVAARARPPVWTWATAGMALAASVAVAVLIARPPAGTDAADHDDVAQGEMFELLLDGDDDDDPVLEAELYEDLDVLTWLAEDDERV